jgi:hypothetical protein
MQRPKVSEPTKPDESGLFLSAQGTRSHRYIPQHADRVLDAPDLPNDFYRNGLDWGSKNKVLCPYLAHVLVISHILRLHSLHSTIVKPSFCAYFHERLDTGRCCFMVQTNERSHRWFCIVTCVLIET